MMISHPITLNLGIMPRSNLLTQSIAEWIVSTEQALAHETLIGNARCAHAFAKYADSRGISRAETVTKELCQDWWAYLDTETDWTPATKNRHLSGCRNWFQWLADRRKIRHNPFLVLEAKDLPKEKAEKVPPEDLSRILTYLDGQEGFTAVRDRAMLALQADKDMTPTEIVSVSEGAALMGVSLGTVAAIESYTEHRQRELDAAGLSDPGKLFLSWHKAPRHRLKPLAPRAVTRALEYWRKKMDRESPLDPIPLHK